jgi:CHASE2 domain-containing sensor protein
MDRKQVVKFWRFTFQGLAIAAWGTMGLTPDWGSFILGLVALIAAFALLPFEKGD